MRLQHDRIGVRPLRRRDARRWAELRAQHADWLKPWEASLPPEAGRPTVSYVEMIGMLRRRARRGEAMPFAVTWDKAMVGQVSVNHVIGGSSRSASLGYWVAQSHAGRGVVPVAVALVCDHLFGVVGLHRLEIAVRPENAASLRVVQKLGFESIGLARGYLHINGQWRDHQLFQLVRDDLNDTVLSRALG